MPLVRLAAFTLFVLLGASVVLAAGTRFARISERAFIAITAALMLVAGLGNRDLWPFSSYPIFPESSARYREAVWYEVRAVDARGLEHAVAPRAWAPLTPFVIEKWIERTFFPRLDDAARARAARFLLVRINSHARNTSAQALRIYRNEWTKRALVYEVRK